MNFGSLFSGIGGFDLGFEQVGMKSIWQCEIDKNCQEVLKKHFPEARLYDDVRTIKPEPVELICGGFPCQDLSIAGKRQGLDGERSGLWFEFARIIDELKPNWVVIENVPGLLSSNDGRDFAVILSGLVKFGYGVSWRILDAQYFGVAQRRRRVFIVGSLGNGDSAKVLFESEGMFGDPPKSRKTGEEVAHAINACSTKSGRYDPSGETYISFDWQSDGDIRINVSEHPNLQTNQTQAVMAWQVRYDEDELRQYSGVSPKLAKSHSSIPNVGVRRLTPTECERLQGFPDGWTSEQSDTQRYKQLGNAVAVPVIRWIGKRIMEL